jgi:hypothetical protein
MVLDAYGELKTIERMKKIEKCSGILEIPLHSKTIQFFTIMKSHTF